MKIRLIWLYDNLAILAIANNERIGFKFESPYLDPNINSFEYEINSDPLIKVILYNFRIYV